MASKKDRVKYIVEYLKARGCPSETAIAICCNIRAESGSEFNPQAIEIGNGAPPFTRSGQGYGLFQFSMYPTNQQLYVKCKSMEDKKAIEVQVAELIKQCQPGKGIWFNSVSYPKFNLSWEEFFKNKRNWTVRDLTFAFMRQYERPADQSQDRYTLYQKEIAELYDWKNYDENGEDNSNNGDHETYNFDCGGERIIPPDKPGPDPDPDPKPPNGGITKKVKTAFDAIEKRYKNTIPGWKVVVPPPYGPYQCVALMSKGFLPIAEPKFKDSYLNGAYDYGKAFHDGLKANQTVMGLSPKKWQWISKSFKKGDLIFYKRSTGNGQAGHVNVATSSTNSYNQNIRAPWIGTDPYIRKAEIKSLGTVYGGIRKFKD